MILNLNKIKNSANILIISFLLILISENVKSNKISKNPLLLLISFDGFRWDYLKMYNLTNFEYLKSIGSSTDYIYNSFVTVTFPNHWSLATGLYEESHGIIANHMYDQQLQEKFTISSPQTDNINWYGQNNSTLPIWTANQRGGNGRKSAAEWIGSEITFINQPIIHIPYNSSKPYEQLVDQFIKLFTDDVDPINFGAMYFDEPDATGHEFGPYSIELKNKLFYLNDLLGNLINKLKSVNLFDKLNIIITSDHGMEEISNETIIYLNKYIDISLFDAYGGITHSNIFLKNASNLELVYESFKKIPNLDVFKKNDIPENLHYKDNIRTGDLLIIAKLGYYFMTSNETISKKGVHGYYNNESSMWPLFIAQGPAFKKNYKKEAFYNVDIYPLMCAVLDVKPGANNGSIHNVEDMLVEYDMKIRIYIILSIIPLISAIITAFCLYVANGKTSSYRSELTGNTNNGYAIVSTSEISDHIDEEEEEDSN